MQLENVMELNINLLIKKNVVFLKLYSIGLIYCIMLYLLLEFCIYYIDLYFVTMLIFVSYTLKDRVLTIEKLKEIKKYISNYTTCYIDILDNDGENKQEYLINKLEKSRLMIVLRTPKINESEWVNKEYEIAKKNNIPIVEIVPNKINKLLRNIMIRRVLNL